MALFAVVVLALAARVVAAEPGALSLHARPGAAKQALGAAPDPAEELFFAIAEEAASLLGGLAPHAALGDLALLSSAASEVGGALGPTGEPTDPFTQYWDGQCSACPAKYYSGDHCWAQGGKLVGSRPCSEWGKGAYCEGLCSLSGTAAKAYQSPGGNIMKLYHETSPEIAAKILATGFRPGHMGWCGPAIYFFGSPDVPETKFGVESHRGAVIEALVDMGKMAHLDKTCRDWHLAKRTYDSATFDPFDGNEFILFNKDRILSTRLYKITSRGQAGTPSHEDECGSGLVGKLRHATEEARQCIDACQGSCGALGRALSAYANDGGWKPARAAVCQERAAFECYLAGDAAKSCSSLMGQADTFHFHLPRSASQLAEECGSVS